VIKKWDTNEQILVLNNVYKSEGKTSKKLRTNKNLAKVFNNSTAGDLPQFD